MPPRPRALAAAALCCALTRARGAPPPVLPSRASTPSVAEEHAALLALAEAIKEENRRLRGESVELARGSSGHRGLKLSWSDLDDICYWLAFLILAVQCGMCACSCTRRKDDGIAKDVKRMGAWASWCGHWSAERSQTFWFLLIYWLLIAVLASRALIQLGVVGDFSSFLVEVYIGYLIAGLFLIMINELWVELRKVFHRTFEWCSEEFAKFRESLSKFKSRMDAQAKSVAESLSPDGMERALHRAEDFVAAHSPRMKACC